MIPIAMVHQNSSLIVLEVDMDIFLTAPTLQLRIAKVNVNNSKFASSDQTHMHAYVSHIHAQLGKFAEIQRLFGLQSTLVTPLAGWKCALMDTGEVCVVLEQLILLQM